MLIKYNCPKSLLLVFTILVLVQASFASTWQRHTIDNIMGMARWGDLDITTCEDWKETPLYWFENKTDPLQEGRSHGPGMPLCSNPAPGRIRITVPDQVTAASPWVGIYDLAGQLVNSNDHSITAGNGEGSTAFTWDGNDLYGWQAPPGLYVVRVSYGNTIKHQRVILAHLIRS